MRVSDQGVAFITAFEGFASRAYRCPAGVITIGQGMTMGSKVFADWWTKKHGRPLKMGDTITRVESNEIFKVILDKEYGAAVGTQLNQALQNRHDAATSMCYNCGTGSLKWKWATYLRDGLVSKSAEVWRTTAVTANGIRLAGLVRRRAAEATLSVHGSYGDAVAPKPATPATPAKPPPSQSKTNADIVWVQESLRTLGVNPNITIDGIDGEETQQAIRSFQKANDLVIDGIVGPATRATIIRRLDERRQLTTTAGVGAGSGAVGGGAEATFVDPSVVDVTLETLYWGIGAAAIVFGLWLLWRYRGKFTGRRVPT